jgi:ATP-dependent helicase HepA
VYAVAECVAPAALHADRFLPATPIRVVVDHALKDRSADGALVAAKLQKGNVYAILDKAPVKRDLLPAMIQAAQKLAATEMSGMVKSAVGAMEAQLGGEIERLEDLRVINDHVRPDEIAGLNAQKTALGDALRGARLRLDAVRLIWRRP